MACIDDDNDDVEAQGMSYSTGGNEPESSDSPHSTPVALNNGHKLDGETQFGMRNASCSSLNNVLQEKPVRVTVSACKTPFENEVRVHADSPMVDDDLGVFKSGELGSSSGQCSQGAIPGATEEGEPSNPRGSKQLFKGFRAKKSAVEDHGEGLVTLFLDKKTRYLCWSLPGQAELVPDQQHCMAVDNITGVSLGGGDRQWGLELMGAKKTLVFEVDTKDVHEILAEGFSRILERNRVRSTMAAEQEGGGGDGGGVGDTALIDGGANNGRWP